VYSEEEDCDFVVEVLDYTRHVPITEGSKKDLRVEVSQLEREIEEIVMRGCHSDVPRITMYEITRL
jgi:hypothetical protein